MSMSTKTTPLKTALCALALCASTLLGYEAKLNFKPPAYVEEMQAKEFIPGFAKPGSLFGTGERPLFADRRAMRPNDLITVEINEATNSTYTTSKKYAGASNGTTTPPSIKYNGQNEENKKVAEFLNDRVDYSYTEPNVAKTFKGGGSQSKSSNITMTLTARIIKVLENGNYYIAGQKDTLVDGELETIRISGVIRPYDITANNTIASKYIADAKIEYEAKGNLSATNKPTKTADAMNSMWPY